MPSARPNCACRRPAFATGWRPQQWWYSSGNPLRQPLSGVAGVGRPPQRAIGPAAEVARGGAPREFSASGAGFVGTPGGQVRFPGSRTTSTRRTLPNPPTAAVDLASLRDGSSAGELIPKLARLGLQRLIQLELAAFLGADRHERSVERLGYRNGYRHRTLTTQVGDLELLIP